MSGSDISENDILLFIRNNCNKKQLKTLHDCIEEKKKTLQYVQTHELITNIKKHLKKYELKVDRITLSDYPSMNNIQKVSFYAWLNDTHIFFSVDFTNMKHTACISFKGTAVPFCVQIQPNYWDETSPEKFYLEFCKKRESILDTFAEKLRHVLRIFYNITHYIVKERYKIYEIYDYDTSTFLN